jgi:hypothetical protein
VIAAVLCCESCGVLSLAAGDEAESFTQKLSYYQFPIWGSGKLGIMVT